MLRQSHLKTNLYAIAIGLLLACSSLANATPLFKNPQDPYIGNPKGNVTIVEFFDYECTYCVSMIPVINTIVRNNPNVRVVYKDFPIRGPASAFAARAALAANKQGKYRRFSHDLLVTNRRLTPNNIYDIAENAGLDVEKLKKDMDSPAIKGQLRNTFRLAHSLGISGTPVFYIGKTNESNPDNIYQVIGAMSQRELQSAINNAARS